MPAQGLLHRALLHRAPCLFLAVLLYLPSIAPATDCSSTHYDENASIKRIIDGDTLHLSDGRRVRLIGINTPELGKKQQHAEPLAEQAKQRLQKLAGTQIKLRWGKEKKDRYGRLLAHAFTPDGRNINALLLATGMAAAIQIPPNLWAYRCYLRTENLARKQQFGIWGQPYFEPLDTDKLTSATPGFHFIRGHLSRVGKSKTALWLNLGEHFALRIHKKDLTYFQQLNFEQLIGQELTVRGWIYLYKGQWRMNLHHPASLKIAP